LPHAKLEPLFEMERGELSMKGSINRTKRKTANLHTINWEWEKFNNDWKKFIEDREGSESRPYLGRSEFHDLVACQTTAWKSYMQLMPI
jgi:hypothetical protein